jgi:hypothetical protein
MEVSVCRSTANPWGAPGAETTALCDGTHPAVSRAAVHALPVTAPQSRTFAPRTDREVEVRSVQGTSGMTVSLLPLPMIRSVRWPRSRQVFDVGGAGFADPKAAEADQHGQRGVVAVDLLAGEQQHAEFGAIQSRDSDGWIWERRMYCAAFDGTRPSMRANRSKPHPMHTRRSIVDAAGPRSSSEER